MSVAGLIIFFGLCTEMLSGTEIAKHGIMKNDKDEIWNIYISTSQKIANKGSIGHSLTFYQKQDQQSKIMSLCLSSFTFPSGVECEILVGNSDNSRCG